MTLAHIEPISGASGDMLLGAVLDAGADLDGVRTILDALTLPGWALHTEDVTRGGIGATRAHVEVTDHTERRDWRDLRALLGHADLPEPVRERSLATFARLAAAEGRIHRIDPDEVHLHEVGALDAVIDIVGVCAGLHLLGVERLTCAPLPQGTGMVTAAHGPLPVPAPAVLELLRGAPVRLTEVPFELCTPTGAALLVEWAEAWAPPPSLTVRAVGYGAGSRDLVEQPNVLRLVLGDPVPGDLAGGDPTGAPPDERAILLEATVDDLSGELVPAILDLLRAAGAHDAWARTVLMKKGRPGVELVCLGPLGSAPALREVLFRESTTLGVRGRVVDRWVLDRGWVEVEVAGNPVRLKVGRLDGEVVNVAPEHDDCAAAARASGLPLKEVHARARAAWEASG